MRKPMSKLGVNAKDPHGKMMARARAATPSSRVKKVATENRTIGRKRVTGANGRKLGPSYPKTWKKGSSPRTVGSNIRYFYKTKGKKLKQAVAISLSVARRSQGLPPFKPRRKR